MQATSQFSSLKFRTSYYAVRAGPCGPRSIGLDYSFCSGAVAQLGERLICIQEVAGSIPTSSTTLKPLWAETRPTRPGPYRPVERTAVFSVVRGPSNGPVAQLARAHPL